MRGRNLHDMAAPRVIEDKKSGFMIVQQEGYSPDPSGGTTIPKALSGKDGGQLGVDSQETLPCRVITGLGGKGESRDLGIMDPVEMAEALAAGCSTPEELEAFRERKKKMAKKSSSAQAHSRAGKARAPAAAAPKNRPPVPAEVEPEEPETGFEEQNQNDFDQEPAAPAPRRPSAPRVHEPARPQARLVKEPKAPRVSVLFDLAGGGQIEAQFHQVLIGDENEKGFWIQLIWDTRYTGGKFKPPFGLMHITVIDPEGGADEYTVLNPYPPTKFGPYEITTLAYSNPPPASQADVPPRPDEPNGVDGPEYDPLEDEEGEAY